jgi:hypothetical protein
LATLLTGNSGRGLPGRLGGSSSNMESVGAPGDKHAHTTVSSHYGPCNLLVRTMSMLTHADILKALYLDKLLQTNRIHHQQQTGRQKQAGGQSEQNTLYVEQICENKNHTLTL